MKKMYIENVGTSLVLDTKTTIAGATSYHIIGLAPDGVTTKLFPSSGNAVVVDGTKLLHIFQAGEIDQLGLWKFHTYALYPTWEGIGGMFPLLVIEKGQ